MHPQSTMAPDKVWFDQRFAGERASRWQGDLVDGAEGAALARRVYVCYDPWQIKDRLHAQRLPAHNRVDLRLPYVGHATAQALQALGLLGQVVDQALAGTLMREAFADSAPAGDWPTTTSGWLSVHAPRRLRVLEQALQIARPIRPHCCSRSS
jgi:hypothetical protein